MKYLKLFEDKNEYYQVISSCDKITPLPFSNYEFSEIEKRIGLLSRKIRLVNGSLNIFIDSWFFLIYKMADEWYIVYDNRGVKKLMAGIYDNIGSINKNPIYYKCDQLEGLIKCLKDIL